MGTFTLLVEVIIAIFPGPINDDGVVANVLDYNIVASEFES